MTVSATEPSREKYGGHFWKWLINIAFYLQLM